MLAVKFVERLDFEEKFSFLDGHQPVKGVAHKCTITTYKQYVASEILSLTSEEIELLCNYRQLISKY
jgi:hypothetical protein